jgi:hypothetical protein
MSSNVCESEASTTTRRSTQRDRPHTPVGIGGVERRDGTFSRRNLNESSSARKNNHSAARNTHEQVFKPGSLSQGLSSTVHSQLFWWRRRTPEPQNSHDPLPDRLRDGNARGEVRDEGGGRHRVGCSKIWPARGVREMNLEGRRIVRGESREKQRQTGATTKARTTHAGLSPPSLK